MRVWRALVLFLWFSVVSLLYAQQDQSLGDAARRFQTEKAEQASQTRLPDWFTSGPHINHDPITEAQLVGWIAGGVPSEDVVTELHNRGIAFLPSHELDELLQQAGADGTVLEEVSKTERRGGNGSSRDEMAALAKIVAETVQEDDRHAFRETIALLKTDSKNPGLYILLAHLLEKQEAWEGVVGALMPAVTLDHDFAYSHGRLAMAC